MGRQVQRASQQTAWLPTHLLTAFTPCSGLTHEKPHTDCNRGRTYLCGSSRSAREEGVLASTVVIPFVVPERPCEQTLKDASPASITQPASTNRAAAPFKACMRSSYFRLARAALGLAMRRCCTFALSRKLRAAAACKSSIDGSLTVRAVQHFSKKCPSMQEHMCPLLQ